MELVHDALQWCNCDCAKRCTNLGAPAAVLAEAEMRDWFRVQLGKEPVHVFALGNVALAAIGPDNEVLVVACTGEKHGMPCPMPGEEPTEVINKQWPYTSMNDLFANIELASSAQRKYLMDSIYGNCHVHEALRQCGLQRITKLDYGADELCDCFRACGLDDKGHLDAFALWGDDPYVGRPAMVLALEPHAIDQFCAVSAQKIMIYGELCPRYRDLPEHDDLDEEERNKVTLPEERERVVIRSVLSAADPFNRLMLQCWGYDANANHMAETWRLYENSCSFLRLRKNAKGFEAPFAISALTNAKTFMGTLPFYVPNKEGIAVRANLVEAWMAHDPPRVELIDFRPDLPPLFKSGRVLNLYRGYAADPQESTNPCPHWFRLVKEVYCQGNKDHFELFMKIMALKIQRPWQKAGVCIVLRGPMGAGKSTFASFLSRIFGVHVLEVSNMARITGRFNSHLVDKLFVVLNEGYFAGSHTDAADIKSFITESTILMEMKHKDTVTIAHLSDLILTTNSDWVVPGAIDNRRFLVLDCSTRLEPEFYRDFYANIKQEATEFMGYCKKLSVPHDFRPGQVIQSMPTTQGAAEQLLHGHDGTVRRWFFDRLSLDEHTFELPEPYKPVPMYGTRENTTSSSVPFFAAEEVKVNAQDLLKGFMHMISHNADMQRYGIDNGLKLNFTTLDSVKMLTQNFDRLFGKGVIKNDGHGYYIVPPVAVLKKAFAKTALGCEHYKWSA